MLRFFTNSARSFAAINRALLGLGYAVLGVLLLSELAKALANFTYNTVFASLGTLKELDPSSWPERLSQQLACGVCS